MSTATEVKEPKKARRVRRDFKKELESAKKELESVEIYVRVRIEVLESLEPSVSGLAGTPGFDGQKIALSGVLARIEGRR